MTRKILAVALPVAAAVLLFGGVASADVATSYNSTNSVNYSYQQTPDVYAVNGLYNGYNGLYNGCNTGCNGVYNAPIYSAPIYSTPVVTSPCNGVYSGVYNTGIVPLLSNGTFFGGNRFFNGDDFHHGFNHGFNFGWNRRW